MNVLLSHAKQPPLLLEELIGVRLLTGPMFEKYNAVLRACANAQSPRPNADDLRRGNRYATTLHVIRSALSKLSRVISVFRVFRGLPAELPDSWDIGARVVEPCVLAMTKDVCIATEHARKIGRSGQGVLLEVQLGQGDCGADLTWLSQYPHEKEVDIGPLSSLQIVGSRVQSAMLIIDAVVRATSEPSPICPAAQLSGTAASSPRKKVIEDLIGQIRAEVRHLVSSRQAEQQALTATGTPGEEHINALERKLADIAASFDDETCLQQAVERIFEAKRCLVDEVCGAAASRNDHAATA